MKQLADYRTIDMWGATLATSKYMFWLEVTDPKSGETVRLEWDCLTLAEAKKLTKLTETKYKYSGKNYVAQMERYGWEEMK
jgi:hypothetical protein